MRFVTVSDARADMPNLTEGPQGTVLTKSGQPVAVLLPIREYRAMRAMLRLAAQPEIAAGVLAAHERVQAGKLDEFVELDADDAAAVQQATV
jgi:prevent-host-death family protein